MRVRLGLDIKIRTRASACRCSCPYWEWRLGWCLRNPASRASPSETSQPP
ncbi:SWIM zinc finger family protein [Listeria booriae]|nr:hypothetical protein [Listeria booriae]